MTTHDTPEATLPCICTPIWTERGLSDPDCPHHDPEADAADLIAALDDWTLVPRVATADWTGSTKRADAEVARLRAGVATTIRRLASPLPPNRTEAIILLQRVLTPEVSDEDAIAALAPSEP